MRKIEALDSVEFTTHVSKLISQAIGEERDKDDKEIAKLQLSGLRYADNRSYLDLALHHYLSTLEKSSHKTNLGSICLLLEQAFSVTHHTVMQSQNPINRVLKSKKLSADALNRALADDPCLVGVPDSDGTPLTVLLQRYATSTGKEEALLRLVELLLELGAKPPAHTKGIDLAHPTNRPLAKLLRQAEVANTLSPRAQLDAGLPVTLADDLCLAITTADSRLFSETMRDISNYYAKICDTSFSPEHEMQKALQTYRISTRGSLLDLALNHYIEAQPKQRDQLHGIIQILNEKYAIPYSPLRTHPIFPIGIGCTSEDIADTSHRLKQYPALVNIAGIHGTAISAALHAYHSVAASCTPGSLNHEKQNRLIIIRNLLDNDAELPSMTINPDSGQILAIQTNKLSISLHHQHDQELLALLSDHHYPRPNLPVDGDFTALEEAIKTPDHTFFNTEIAACLVQFHDGDSLQSAMAKYIVAEHCSLLDLALQTYTTVIASGDRDNLNHIASIVYDLQNALKVPQLTGIHHAHHPIVMALLNSSSYSDAEFTAIIEKHQPLINIASDTGTPMTVALDLYAKYKNLPDEDGGPKQQLLNRIGVLLANKAQLLKFRLHEGMPAAVRTKTNAIRFDQNNKALLQLLTRYHPYFKCFIFDRECTEPLQAVAVEEDDGDETVISSNTRQAGAIIRPGKESLRVEDVGIAGIFARRHTKLINTTSRASNEQSASCEGQHSSTPSASI
ncbi:MAG: hypothetical protein P1U34_01025 [Coxiellaceae bacterium]|nr:hypothetical protein [Coxiellaceae bacterium]